MTAPLFQSPSQCDAVLIQVLLIIVWLQYSASADNHDAWLFTGIVVRVSCSL